MPRAPKFTDSTIQEKAVPGKRLHVSGTPNLYLYTSAGPKRKQRWVLRISRPRPRKARDDESKRKSNVTERSLGPYPQVTIEMAKNRADHTHLILKRDKINPFEVDWNDGATTTFGQVTRMWLDDRFPGPSKQRREAEHMLFFHAKELVEKPIIKIRAKHIAEVLRPLSKEMPDRFRRVLIRIESVFDYAKSKDLFTAENPARWKEKQKNFYPTFKNKRGYFPAMLYEDLPEFVQALRQHQNNSVAAIALEICVLTAARSGEILGMRWSEVDLENRTWTIPAARMKGGREHVVPLSDRAVELLKRRYEQRGISDYVFTAHRRPTPMDEKSMRQILHKINKSVTVHGFRSSFSDWAGDETDFASETIEACLAHAVGNQSARAYRRRTALKKRRELMEAWAAHCEGRQADQGARAAAGLPGRAPSV